MCVQHTVAVAAVSMNDIVQLAYSSRLHIHFCVCRYRGEFEERIKAVLKEVADAKGQVRLT